MTGLSIFLLVLSVLLFIMVCVFGYGLYNSYQKITYYEDWYIVFEEYVTGMKDEIERIDKLGAFEADDEVGYFFKALKQMVDDLHKMGFYQREDEDVE